MVASQALLTVLNLARDSTGRRIIISQTISSGSSKVCCCGGTLFFFPFLYLQIHGAKNMQQLYMQ
jgi:hypothetical protein